MVGLNFQALVNNIKDMKCIKCGSSIMQVMLHRTAQKGQIPADWMCMQCIQKHEPELAKNIKKDDQVLTDLNNIFYGDK
jgi:hypothetical protein